MQLRIVACTKLFFTSPSQVMSVHEKVVYHALNSASTIVLRNCCILSSIYGAATALETFGLERYKRNIAKAENGLLWTLTDKGFNTSVQPLPFANTEQNGYFMQRAVENMTERLLAHNAQPGSIGNA